MSEDVVLKKAVGTDTLRYLNSGKCLALSLLWALGQEDSDSFGKYVPSDETVEDWIAALKSGKKIVNPMSPREELEIYYADQEDAIKYPIDMEGRIRAIAIRKGIKKAVEIIAKEHPDVADWLGDQNA